MGNMNFLQGRRKILLLLGLIGALIIIGVFVFPHFKNALNPNNQKASGTSANLQQTSGDFNGDGKMEYVETNKLGSAAGSNVSISIVNSNGDTLAKTPDAITIKEPMSDSFTLFRLNSNEKKDFFSFDFIAGPHEFEKMFFGMYKDKVLPICLTKEVTGPYDCLFYTGKAGGFIVKDLNNDGFAEVVETRDEYPSEGQLSDEEKNAITQSFGTQGVDSLTQGAMTIARREKGGRGRTVVWDIYTYDGEIFNKQEGKSFDDLFAILKKDNPDWITKSDLSQESLDYSQFVRSYWTGEQIK